MGKMGKLLEHFSEIGESVQTMADTVGPELGKIVGVGLTMATAAQVVATVVAPELTAGIVAGAMLGGMVLQWLRGRSQKKALEAMAADGLTPSGPAVICGEHGQAEFQAAQQAMENLR